MTFSIYSDLKLFLYDILNYFIYLDLFIGYELYAFDLSVHLNPGILFFCLELQQF